MEFKALDEDGNRGYTANAPIARGSSVMKSPFCAIFLCMTIASQAFALKPTNLEPLGNEQAAFSFQTYQKLNSSGGCRSGGKNKRVLLTGFGLFEGLPYNISGAVVESMSDPAFWPSKIDTSRPITPGLAPRPGRLAESEGGGRAANRVLTVDGKDYDVCFLLLDVQWDLAASIIVHEIARFEPDMVLMTGVAGGKSSAQFETRAVNSASESSGYASNGKPSADNTPKSSWIVAEADLHEILPMSWNADRLARTTRSMIERLKYTATVSTSMSPYVCNNVSYVVLHALRGKPLQLAGDRIKIPALAAKRKVSAGFFHYPEVNLDHPELKDYGPGIAEWARIMTLVFRTQLSK